MLDSLLFLEFGFHKMSLFFLPQTTTGQGKIARRNGLARAFLYLLKFRSPQRVHRNSVEAS